MTTGVADFADRVVIVTGAASGIGEASARQFAHRGAAVAVVDLDEPRMHAVVDSIGADGGLALACVADVSRGDDWERLRDRVLATWGRIDVVHNNAFVLRSKPTHETSDDQWDRQIAVNLSAIHRSVRTLAPELADRRGTIVNTSSVHAHVGFAGSAAYAASKGAILSLTRQLAVEYGPAIRVNTVSPGPIFTPPWNSMPEAQREWFARATALLRLGGPDEVANAVCFLASSAASYISGAELLVDGGFVARKMPA